MHLSPKEHSKLKRATTTKTTGQPDLHHVRHYLHKWQHQKNHTALRQPGPRKTQQIHLSNSFAPLVDEGNGDIKKGKTSDNKIVLLLCLLRRHLLRVRTCIFIV